MRSLVLADRLLIDCPHCGATLDTNSLTILANIAAEKKPLMWQYMPFFALLGAAVTGAIGFYLANFVMQPILFYRRIKQDTASDLIVYANAIAPGPGSNTVALHTRVEERRSAQRRRSAELTAVYITLPKPYKMILKQRDEYPEDAASELLGLSNTMNYAAATERVRKIQTLLKLPRIAA